VRQAVRVTAGRRLSWLGHASVLIEASGARLLTDPALRDRLLHLRRHTAPVAVPDGLDAVLISHVHHDHLDRASLRLLARASTSVVVPAGAAALVADLGFAEVHEVRVGDTVTLGGAAVRAVPAWHPSRRHPRAPEIPALGYVVDRVWFAGDTDLHDDMAALRGQVDVALLPVWGWGTTLGPGHLDPSRAAQAAALVAPRTAIPIHWGTYFPVGLARRHPALLRDPPQRFTAAAAAVASRTEVVVLEPGATWTGDASRY
jgi:L-ascorbate metabolism protein UlaG (beta-lactamase superfamily)